jgi:alcohol dehydrogenase
LGELARELGFRRTLLVADRGLVEAGHVEQAVSLLRAAGVAAFPFHGFEVNPDSAMVEAGRDFASPLSIDSLIGLGGGSSLDCAKGVNFLLTNGGRIEDYQGYGKATQPLLPMIGIPTTAGTGSEAQSYALISDAESKMKMACGDPKAFFRVAILDPALLVSTPQGVRATTGYDAISHAVESFVTTRGNAMSECFSREAWRLLSENFEACLENPEDLEVQGEMQLGAFLAGLAIENSMLGAAHACANPLTAHYGTIHGVAIAVLLADVVRWNEPVVGAHYAEFDPHLAHRLEEWAALAGLPTGLKDIGVEHRDLPQLAHEASEQWTGRFNPRPFDAAGALEIYQCAY